MCQKGSEHYTFVKGWRSNLSCMGHPKKAGRRAGTENVPCAVALGEAAVQAKEHLKHDTLLRIREYFYNRLTEIFGDRIYLNGDEVNCLPNTLNISFIGSIGSDILVALPEICASIGSACHSGSKTISPVLAAMGISEYFPDRFFG